MAYLFLVRPIGAVQEITLVTAIAGLVSGVLGAVLGVINTWRAFDRDRVRLLVTP